MQMPVPDAAILSRKPEIVRRLQAALPADAVIFDPTEVRAYECDALTAYRCPPLAVVLPALDRGGRGGPESLSRVRGAGGAARRGDQPRGRVAADGGRGAARGGAD